MKISIPEPCHENWDAMTSVAEQQRHCAACDRTLTDFSGMTDAQIGNHLRRNPGKLCGRFAATQLNRKLALSWPRRFAGLRAAAAASGLLLALPAVGQGVEPPQTVLRPSAEVDIDNSRVPEKKAATTLPEKVTIKGAVYDAEGFGLIGASVQIKGTTTGAVTDFDGAYSLEVPAGSVDTLLVSYTGFLNKEVKIDVEKVRGGASLNIDLEVNGALLGDIIVVGGYVEYSHSSPHRLFVTPVRRYVIWPVKNAVRSISDWRAGRFERRAARQLRQEERREDRAASALLRQAEPGKAPPVKPDSKQETVPPAQLGFLASPNPFSDHLRVTFTLAANGPYQLGLYGAAGRLVGRWEGQGKAGQQELVLEQQLSNLPAGTYFLELRTPQAASVLTVVRR